MHRLKYTVQQLIAVLQHAPKGYLVAADWDQETTDEMALYLYQPYDLDKPAMKIVLNQQEG